ncbi:MAG: hypothetical protein ACI915_000164 [Gammaproteobacteria bacterium]|jgi:hypothetical protein
MVSKVNKPRSAKRPPSVRYFLRFEWYLLFSILAAELVLANSLPPNILTDWPTFEYLVDLVQHIAPVLGNITDETAAHPEAVRFYIVVTFFLMLIKAGLFFHWINSKHLGIYRFLVISPLIDTKPTGKDHFILEPLRRERGLAPQNKPRSMFSRVFWSSLILLFAIAMAWGILTFFSPPGPTTRGDGDEFRALVAEGFSMWSSWTVKLLTFESVLLAMSGCIVRDYGVFFRHMFVGKRKNDE